MDHKDRIREKVKEHYSAVAGKGDSCCGPEPCCSTAADAGTDPGRKALRLGYGYEEIESTPEGANLGLGCGNPVAIASIRPGEVVLDLGAGAGFDAFLAARKTGPTGRVIGVDMTREMVEKAERNAVKAGVENVEFRLGKIEELPVEENSIDLIISNCVINLSPDKAAVYREAFRVLKPGGRLAISDVVAKARMPEEFRNDAGMISCCVGGAEMVEDLEAMLRSAGFGEISIDVDERSADFIKNWAPGSGAENYVASASIVAKK
jgi:SAM-dependent methyltransferase